MTRVSQQSSHIESENYALLHSVMDLFVIVVKKGDLRLDILLTRKVRDSHPSGLLMPQDNLDESISTIFSHSVGKLCFAAYSNGSICDRGKTGRFAFGYSVSSQSARQPSF